MHDDDRPIGRVLTRRELVALFGAAAAASFAHGAAAQSGTGQPPTVVPSCVVHPQQTEGPFFVDEKLLRSDVRADSRTGVVSAGSPLELRLTIAQVSAAGACAPLAGAQVDIWQCDALGRYSDVNDRRNSTNGQTFLRGHQVADAKGNVQFTTIYPGWYPGRAVHIHFKVRSGTRELTSQLYFDDAFSDQVFATAPYAGRSAARKKNEEDGIFRNEGGRQLILDVARSGDGYAAGFDIGLA